MHRYSRRADDDIVRQPWNRPSPRRLIQVTGSRVLEDGERVVGIKGIIFRAGIILLGIMAYIGLGMALATAG